MPIRVLYLHHVNQIAGAENSLRLLLRHLDRDRVVPLFAGPANGPFPDILIQDRVPVFSVSFGPLRNARALLVSTRRLGYLIRKHRISLLHANGPQTNICAGLAGRLMRVPVVWHARNLLHGKMWDVDRRFAWLSDRIICNSEAIRQRFRGSRAWKKTVTILNAVDTNEFNPQVPREPFRRELDIAPQASVVGIVGRIGLGKGHEHFIEAAIRLLHDGSGGHFLVIGDTMFPEDAWRMEQLSRRVAAAGQEKHIRFLGLRKDIPQVMRGLDILVLASDAEPCGRVLFEGMASGTAIVATNTGGTPEIVRDGKDGILVPPCDPAALARTISRLIQDAPLRQALGRSGLARVDQEFTVERYVAKTLEVYESVTRTP